jgi:hypothetical protein
MRVAPVFITLPPRFFAGTDRAGLIIEKRVDQYNQEMGQNVNHKDMRERRMVQ